MPSKIKPFYFEKKDIRICQGDIYKDLMYDVKSFKEGNSFKTLRVYLPFIVILSQDCDLEQDYKNREIRKDKHDKYLRTILFSPAYNSEDLKAGTHLGHIKLTMEYYNSERMKIIRKNNNERYHTIEKSEDFEFPELVIDFKHYYTLPLEKAYETSFKKNYVCTINELYRESLSHRFAFYLSRIGTPDNYTEENPTEAISK